MERTELDVESVEEVEVEVEVDEDVATLLLDVALSDLLGLEVDTADAVETDFPGLVDDFAVVEVLLL